MSEYARLEQENIALRRQSRYILGLVPRPRDIERERERTLDELRRANAALRKAITDWGHTPIN